MRCSISSRAGQVLASGYLFVQPDADGDLRLNLQTDGGKFIEGGKIGEDGDMAIASQELFRQFFNIWGMSDVTLTVRLS